MCLKNWKLCAVLFAAILNLAGGESQAAEKLPDNIQWLNEDSEPEWSDPQAKKGGKFYGYLSSFPLTLRTVGPDSNGAFRGHILDNQMALIGVHPNTEKIIPQLATHWAYSDDNKIMYFKLDKNARWSDGKPVLASDFAFTLEMMRSKDIVAPWYNDYYTKEFDRIIIYDDHTLAVVSTKVRPRDDMHLELNLSPRPKHWYGGKIAKDFVKKYNWEIEPNTGPYQISKVKKGKSIEFERKKDWWAKDLRYYRHRFNVDRAIFNVIRDESVAWEHFLRGKLSSFAVTFPSFWHEKATGKDFENGYIKKLWFFTNGPESATGMWLNTEHPLLKDKNVRLGIHHAMNVEKMLKTVLRGDYFRLDQHYVGYGDYTEKSIKARAWDLKKATEYFQKAGWTKRGGDGILTKDGQRMSFKMTYVSEEHTPRVVMLKEEAKKAGVEITLNRMDGATAFKSFLEKKHDIAWMGWSTGLRPAFWEHYHSANAHKPQTNNISNLDDKELDKVIDAYRAALTKEERVKLSKQAQQMIHDSAVFIPTYRVPYYRVAYWGHFKLPKVPGARLYSSSFSFTDGLFWYDENADKELEKARDKNAKFGEAVTIDTTYKAL